MPVSDLWWERFDHYNTEDVEYLKRFSSIYAFDEHFGLYVTHYYLFNTTKISIHKAVEILKAMGV